MEIQDLPWKTKTSHHWHCICIKVEILAYDLYPVVSITLAAPKHSSYAKQYTGALTTYKLALLLLFGKIYQHIADILCLSQWSSNRIDLHNYSPDRQKTGHC